jgi:uncharacterized membrane protein
MHSNKRFFVNLLLIFTVLFFFGIDQSHAQSRPKKKIKAKTSKIVSKTKKAKKKAAKKKVARKTRKISKKKASVKRSAKTNTRAVTKKRQCQAITKDGARCKRPAMPGSKYCWQHAQMRNR